MEEVLPTSVEDRCGWVQRVWESPGRWTDSLARPGWHHFEKPLPGSEMPLLDGSGEVVMELLAAATRRIGDETS